jgi:iron complex transport system substrate-binding protein
MFMFQACQTIEHNVRGYGTDRSAADSVAAALARSVGSLDVLMGGRRGFGSFRQLWVSVTALAMLAACSNPRVAAVAPTTSPALVSSTHAPTTTVAPVTTPVASPLAGTDTSVVTTAPKPLPTAVVSLSSTATETLFALGAGALVKAVDSESTYPLSAPRTDLTSSAPDLDKLMALTPDLVVMSADANGAVAALTQRGVDVLLQPPALSLEDSYSQIIQLGAAVGKTAEAEQLVTSMKAKIAAIVAQTPPTPLRYYHERTDQFASISSSSFLGQLYGLLNLRSIADTSSQPGDNFPTLSAQAVLNANPDLIVLADGNCCRQTIDTLRARPGWSALAAVTTNTVVSVDDDLANRWGPRIVDLLQAVSGRLLARAAP